MPDFRRYLVAGGTYFFTLVTADRRPLFRSAAARNLLGDVMRSVGCEQPFETVAIVLLPEHLHTIWRLPSGDEDYCGRWQAIKAQFTAAWIRRGGGEAPVAAGYRRQRRRGVWQPRFFEHMIRDEEDLCAHADYIHYNPVKHGLVERPADWSWSSFGRFVASGDYGPDWGACAPCSVARVNSELVE